MGFPIRQKLEKEVTWELGALDADLNAATGTLLLFTIPNNTMIHGVKAFVETAVTGSTAEIVGDVGDDNGWLEDGFAAATGVFPLNVQDTSTKFAGAYAFDSNPGGTDALDVSITNEDKYFASGGVINFDITGTATAGKVHFVIEFTRLK